MSEGVIDTFEFVDVDIEHRQLFIGCDPGQFPFQLLVKQYAVRQICERIVMREVRDALFGTLALGDILVRGYPTAAEQRLVYDQYRTPVSRIDDVVSDIPQRYVAQDRRTKTIN